MPNPESQILGDSKERVALEMAKFIFEKIYLFETVKEKSLERKTHFFNLYYDCLAVILKPEPVG
jgi:hypothetical protein